MLQNASFSFVMAGYLLVVNYGDSGLWDPQDGTAVKKFLLTLSSLIVVVSCILIGAKVKKNIYKPIVH